MAKKILYVEDDLDTRNLVKEILEKEGYEVDVVRDGDGALEKLGKDRFDLLLLDIMLPDMSGWDLFQRVKKIGKYKAMKIAFLSVLEITEERKGTLRKAGVSDYIMKPFDNKDLVNRINAILE